jgi:hypothetical protein
MGGAKSAAMLHSTMMQQQLILQVPAAAPRTFPFMFPELFAPPPALFLSCFPNSSPCGFAVLCSVGLGMTSVQALAQQQQMGSMRPGFPFSGVMGQQP